MAIIIIANIPDTSNQVQPVQTSPSTAPLTDPQSTLPPLKAPILAPKPTKPTKPVVQPEAENAFYGKLNSLIDGFKKANPEDQSQWIDAVSNFEFDSGGGFLSIGDWLASKMTARSPEEAQNDAQLLIWKGLKNVKPNGNLIGWLKAALPHERHTGLSDLSSIDSERFKRAFSYLRPYLMFLKNPESPEAGARPIDDDILLEYDRQAISAGEAAYKQANRSYFKDSVLDQATGKTRLQFAREEFEKAVSAIDPKWLKGSNKEAVFADAKRILKQMNPQYVSLMENESSPYWFTSEMFAPRGIGKELLDIAWDKMRAGSNLSLDAENAETGDTAHDAISTEQFEQFKNRNKEFTTRDKKTIIEEAPYEYLNLFDDDPEQQEKIQDRLPAIQPFVPVKDRGGNVITDGDKRMKMAENPEFEKNVLSIIERLYGSGSPPRRILDENGRPKIVSKQIEQTTKDALWRIGQFYAKSLSDDRDESKRADELGRELGPYLTQPLAFKHYDGPPLREKQQYAFALREVMLDIMEFLGNDKNYAALTQSGQKAVAVLKREIRTAALLLISDIIAGE